jgi:hypothetical protein
LGYACRFCSGGIREAVFGVSNKRGASEERQSDKFLLLRLRLAKPLGGNNDNLLVSVKVIKVNRFLKKIKIEKK